MSARFLRLILAVTLLLNLGVLIQMGSLANQNHILTRSPKLILAFSAAGGLVLLAAILELILLIKASHPGVLRFFNSFPDRLKRLGKWNYLVFGVAVGLFSALALGNFLGRYWRFVDSIYLRLFLFWLLSLVGMVLLKAAGGNQSWGRMLAASLVFGGAVFKLVSFMPDWTNYPFSLGWSEASRYYYASLFFSKSLYGQAIPPSVLHPSRYLMQALPFLISNAPIWVHRFWQDFLWLGASFLTAILLVRRCSKMQPSQLTDRLVRWIFILWASLFLLMPPVYYHLLVPVILVLWAFNCSRPFQTLIIVLLASAWAGVSRVNWIPVPGMLAAVLYFLEVELVPRLHQTAPDGPHDADQSTPATLSRPGFGSMLRYLVWPLVWFCLGSLIGFATQSAYKSWSGNPPDQFGSSFSSDLLWYRLLPNATYPLGVLINVALVVFPLAIILGGIKSVHWLRRLGIWAILFVLFAGGIVVSVKIGGGSNLHNLDAFLTLLMVAASYAFFNQVAQDGPIQAPRESYRPSPLVTWLALALPVIFALASPSAPVLPSPAVANKALAVIQQAVDQAGQNNGKVLMLTERQLLLFKNITGAAMQPDYEKVFLMEMAMGNNRNYLDTFAADLKAHKYALLVSEPVKLNYQDRTRSFNEENNAWVDRVSKVILCYYEPVKSAEITQILKPVRAQLLVPRQPDANCP
jgi:hypothetical protein